MGNSVFVERLDFELSAQDFYPKLLDCLREGESSVVEGQKQLEHIVRHLCGHEAEAGYSFHANLFLRAPLFLCFTLHEDMIAYRFASVTLWSTPCLARWELLNSTHGVIICNRSSRHFSGRE